MQKLWILHKKFKDKIKEDSTSEDNEIEIFTNQMIEKINYNLEKFHYNVIIANLYEAYNFFTQKLNQNISKKNLLDSYAKFLSIISPVVPHFTSECLSELSIFEKREESWPKVDDKYLNSENINLAVQINGKMREILYIQRDLDEEEILKVIANNEKLKKHIENKKIIKKIFVKNKIINLIIK